MSEGEAAGSGSSSGARLESERNSAALREEYFLQRLCLQWVNDVLPNMTKATSLHKDFCDGSRFIALAEAILLR